jgi:hypothetical protein
LALCLTVDALTAPAVPREDTRLRTPPREVSGAELLALIDCAGRYPVYGRDNQMIQAIDARRCVQFIDRRLIVGKLNRKAELTGLWTAQGVSASQIKNVMRLKPSRVSICNKATVVKVMPTTYTHRSSLMAGF